jgi:hypothetical protein
MHIMRPTQATRDEQPATVPMLLGLTVVVLTMQSPLHNDAPGLSFPQLEFPTPSQVMEMRPDSPPPWADGDQLVMDEPDQTSVVTGVQRDQVGPDELRTRPER